jgi:hypothetical protein
MKNTLTVLSILASSCPKTIKEKYKYKDFLLQVLKQATAQNTLTITCPRYPSMKLPKTPIEYGMEMEAVSYAEI